MAEEKQDTLPKTTLIKHSRKSPDAAASRTSDDGKPAEKKRVVVVRKKKVVVVKRPSSAAVPESREEAYPAEHQTVTPAAVSQPEAASLEPPAPAPKPAAADNLNIADKPMPEQIPTVVSAAPEKVEAPRSEGNTRASAPEEPLTRQAQAPSEKRPPRAPSVNRSSADQPVRHARPIGTAPDSPRREGSSGPVRDSFTKPRPQGTRAGVLRGKPVSSAYAPQRPSGPPPAGGDNRGFRDGGGRDFRDSRDSRGGEARPGAPPPQGRFPGRPGGYQGRPGAPGTGGPGFPRREGPGMGRPRPGGPGGPPPGSSPVGEENQKTVKKVFKPKNKQQREYLKKKEIYEEKNFQIKKKSSHKVNPVPKKIDIMEVITVSELAKKMNLKASELIGKLMGMGMMVTINQQIDSDSAQLLADEYGCQINVVSLYEETLIRTEGDETGDLLPRPPIVTVMGHVDHGKTKLLDAIRESDVVAGEFGGITQHIGAYEVHLPEGDIVFLDTPGHSAFTLMRARGAQVTDIVILVVAANDGVMPQTKEAIDHAKEARVPIIVAINKIDLPEANPDRVKQQLSEYDLMPEDWGGSTLYCEISALKKIGIDTLLETILLQAEMLELSANYDCRAEGKVIESRVDHGRGIVSTVIIERGTLRVGDPFVAGIYPGKVRAMFDDKGSKIDEATPSTPVEILGFTGIPSAGAPFQVTESDKHARQIGFKRQELERQGEASNVKKVTLDNLFDSIQDGEMQELKVIIKGDVHGSVEALQSSLEKLSTSEIRLVAIRASAGAIIEDDINLASASNAIVIGFNVRPTPKAKLLADREKIDVRKYNIIYDAVDDMRLAMEGMLSPEIREEVIGKVEVRDVFKVPKIGLIAGCYVLEGKVIRNAAVHVLRDSVELYTGKVTSLRRFKDDAREVVEGYECGIGIDSYQDVQVGDILEIFQKVEIAKKLS